MKVSRSVLKQLVKECLTEILTEGLGSTQEVLTSSSRPKGGPTTQMAEVAFSHTPRRTPFPSFDEPDAPTSTIWHIFQTFTK